MNKEKIKKVGEWIHRIVGFTIFQSFIVVVGFVGLYISLQILNETNNFNYKTQIGLIQTAFAISYLQIANLFYWIMDINLFDFKKLWRKNE